MARQPTRHRVVLTHGAEHDLEALVDYLATADSPASAHHVLNRLAHLIQGLSESPERGSHPRELTALGIREYRQVLFKPYRVIYRVLGNQVVIYLIADGRRDMPSLLARRLLGG